nr:MAG TPA: hypothetical protein [Bacteriophage sp.]
MKSKTNLKKLIYKVAGNFRYQFKGNGRAYRFNFL